MFLCRLARELNYLCFCIANCAFDFFEESKQSNVLLTLGFCCRDLQTNHFTSNSFSSLVQHTSLPLPGAMSWLGKTQLIYFSETSYSFLHFGIFENFQLFYKVAGKYGRTHKSFLFSCPRPPQISETHVFPPGLVNSLEASKKRFSFS